ncbi:hypothetical protein [Sphingopyxis sp. KK2]|uniref:hypothetical protein n=1 Tax=Sphingopyxis sp. KK2 TaxID=1855727 RepID=UPI001181A94A|nr:hypothetical protein [Sphingopyxis sp. KK2]
MRTWMAAALLAAGAIGAAPVAQAMQADGAAGEAEAEAIGQMISDAFALDYSTQKDQIRDAFIKIEARAKASAARFASDPDTARSLQALQGIGAFYAAQHNDPEWSDIEGQKQEILWLDETVRLLGPVLAAQDGIGENYEFRGAAGQLFDQGLRFDDPRLAEWSAMRVQANRYRVKAFPDDWFEKILLAEALYDHGWMTKDKALLDEAAAIAETIPEDEMRGSLRDKRDAVAAGKPPYEKPGD